LRVFWVPPLQFGSVHLGGREDAELEKEEQQEREQAQKSSSGSSVWSTISSVASGIGGALLSLIPALRVIHSPLSISYEIPVAYNQPHR
jgi:flagellar motor component MotA